MMILLELKAQAEKEEKTTMITTKMVLDTRKMGDIRRIRDHLQMEGSVEQ